jgi:hypothetical protein
MFKAITILIRHTIYKLHTKQENQEKSFNKKNSEKSNFKKSVNQNQQILYHFLVYDSSLQF